MDQQNPTPPPQPTSSSAAAATVAATTPAAPPAQPQPAPPQTPSPAPPLSSTTTPSISTPMPPSPNPIPNQNLNPKPQSQTQLPPHPSPLQYSQSLPSAPPSRPPATLVRASQQPHLPPSAAASASAGPPSISSPSTLPSASAPSPRGGVAIGVPAHRPNPSTSQPASFSPSYAHFGGLGRTGVNLPEPSSNSSASQVRPSIQGVQGMGMLGSHSTSSQMRPGGIPAHHQQRPVQSSLRPVSTPSNQLPSSQIDPSERLDPEVEDVLMDIADDFVESVTTFGCSLAKHRKSTTLEAKDILTHLERNWNIALPGFAGDEIKSYRKPLANDIHKERLVAIKKSIAATETANTIHSSGQAAGHARGSLALQMSKYSNMRAFIDTSSFEKFHADTKKPSFAEWSSDVMESGFCFSKSIPPCIYLS
ncbi:Transcription initiation factor [Parasponia andersonii]|uniref:Transcription initiation factor n=1 Tax=Parasponia andersonii TaxID=3476 RepID=A0A2P5B203_PARAD|nr:Transcription initiation factor [Parasponia andersonii]